MKDRAGMLRALFRSEADYHRAERWWAEFWTRIPGSERWQSPWLKTTFVDGTPMLNGDGILSAKQPETARAFKVIQEDDTVRGRILWWKQTWDSDDENLTMLVIVIVPSDEALALASELLKSWVTGSNVEDSGGSVWAEPTDSLT